MIIGFSGFVCDRGQAGSCAAGLGSHAEQAEAIAAHAIEKDVSHGEESGQGTTRLR